MLSPEILVETSPEEFVFSVGTVRLPVPTTVYVGRGNERDAWAVRSVGHPPANLAQVLRVALFDEGDALVTGATKFDVLVLFFRYGMASVARETFILQQLLRPRLTLKGLPSLAPALHGYQYYLLPQAAARAGARRVKFS